MNVEMYFEGYLWARFFGDGYLVIGICGCNVWASFFVGNAAGKFGVGDL